MTVEAIKLSLKEKLKPTRFIHSEAVAETAAALAALYGVSPQKAYLAGILHDCAKHMTKEELYDSIKKYNINLDEISLKMPQILHSFVGAYEARTLYGADDDEIFDAIYYHTIGKANMTGLTSIIYLADAIEPNRDYPGVEVLRKLSKENLNEAVFEYTKYSVKFILAKNKIIHPNAIEIINSHIIANC